MSLIRSGDLLEHVIRDTAPGKLPQNCPAGTRSQYVRYTDLNGKLVLEGHRYLRPDGTLGASGKLDPKRLLVGKEIWYV